MMRRDSLDEQIKQKITSIIEDVNSNGLRWKSEHKRLYHFLKRKKRGHIPDDFTIEDYERYIHNIINGIENEIYLYSIYEEDIFDFEVSPFETIATRHVRSELERDFQIMNGEEQLKLLSVDVSVIKNARKIVNHISEVYDFSSTNKPEKEWWWHLDKVISDAFVIKGNLFVVTDVAL